MIQGLKAMNKLSDYERLFSMGRSVQQVAESLNVAEKTADRARRLLGDPSQRQVAIKRAMSERDESVRVATMAGATAREISERLGILKREVQRSRQRLRRSGQLPPSKNTGRPMPEDVVNIVERMLDDGASYKEVSRTIGTDEKWIRHRYPGRGWTAQQSAQYRHMRRAMNKLDGIPKTGLDWD